MCHIIRVLVWSNSVVESEVMRFRAGNDLIKFIDDFRKEKLILDRSKAIRHLLNIAREKIDKENELEDIYASADNRTQ